jgi:hypothetical protein
VLRWTFLVEVRLPIPRASSFIGSSLQSQDARRTGWIAEIGAMLVANGWGPESNLRHCHLVMRWSAIGIVKTSFVLTLLTLTSCIL